MSPTVRLDINPRERVNFFSDYSEHTPFAPFALPAHPCGSQVKVSIDVILPVFLKDEEVQ
jgi:hypothetical protein